MLLSAKSAVGDKTRVHVNFSILPDGGCLDVDVHIKVHFHIFYAFAIMKERLDQTPRSVKSKKSPVWTEIR